ncbi:MAG: cytochrome c maturation protein CcmE [Chloroflexi bacterium]|nr:cytochrome c maturation protein CcmE [Chloroflexota bacterium]
MTTEQAPPLTISPQRTAGDPGASVEPPAGRWRPSSAAAKLLVCGVLIASALVYLVSTAMSTTMVYYVTAPELKSGTGAAARDQVRLAGWVVGPSVERQGNSLRFAVTDLMSGEQVQVTYKGVVPDIFGDGIEVIVDGRYAREREVFEATTLLAKCPSKFEGQEPAAAAAQS